jgi:hypothetical protein
MTLIFVDWHFLANPISQKWVDAITHLSSDKSACHNQFRQAHPLVIGKAGSDVLLTSTIIHQPESFG